MEQASACWFDRTGAEACGYDDPALGLGLFLDPDGELQLGKAWRSHTSSSWILKMCRS